jgi:hypothetical protein
MKEILLGKYLHNTNNKEGGGGRTGIAAHMQLPIHPRNPIFSLKSQAHIGHH